MLKIANESWQGVRTWSSALTPSNGAKSAHRLNRTSSNHAVGGVSLVLDTLYSPSIDFRSYFCELDRVTWQSSNFASCARATAMRRKGRKITWDLLDRPGLRPNFISTRFRSSETSGHDSNGKQVVTVDCNQFRRSSAAEKAGAAANPDRGEADFN